MQFLRSLIGVAIITVGIVAWLLVRPAMSGRIERPGRVEVTLLRADGSQVADATVMVLGHDDRVLGEVACADGRVVFERLPPGSCLLTAVGADCAVTSVPVEVFSSATQSVTMRLRTGAACRLLLPTRPSTGLMERMHLEGPEGIGMRLCRRPGEASNLTVRLLPGAYTLRSQAAGSQAFRFTVTSLVPQEFAVAF